MSMDIVERLNTRLQDSPLHAECLMDEATSEIAKLREEVELWRQSEATCEAQYAKLAAEKEVLRERNETLQAEVERLRRQLVMR